MSPLYLVYRMLAVLTTLTPLDFGLKVAKVFRVVALSRIAHQVDVWVRVNCIPCLVIIDQDADPRDGRFH